MVAIFLMALGFYPPGHYPRTLPPQRVTSYEAMHILPPAIIPAHVSAINVQYNEFSLKKKERKKQRNYFSNFFTIYKQLAISNTAGCRGGRMFVSKGGGRGWGYCDNIYHLISARHIYI